MLQAWPTMLTTPSLEMIAADEIAVARWEWAGHTLQLDWLYLSLRVGCKQRPSCRAKDAVHAQCFCLHAAGTAAQSTWRHF